MPGPRDYTQATRAALVDLAGGACYFLGCQERLIKFVAGEPYIDYHIAHIRDAKPGNRYDSGMTDDERRAFRNLILLCKPHHDLIDKRHPNEYSIDDLEGWKAAREGSSMADLENLGAIPEEQLEELVRDAATAIIQSTLELGGKGGNVPGAGGGGGGVFGSGTGGPGGPGGNISVEGTPGGAPGAGGGGGGAIGPERFGAEGGGGGEMATTVLDVEGLTKLHVQVGEGGTEGNDGGDTWVAGEFADGSIKELLRAKGGTGGRSPARIRDERDGPVLSVVSALLADAAQIRDGLAYILGGGWDSYTIPELPGSLNGALLVIVEPIVSGSRVTELQFELFDAQGASMTSASLQVELPDAEPPVCLSRIFYFSGIEVTNLGLWHYTVQSGGHELARVPVRLALRGV